MLIILYGVILSKKLISERNKSNLVRKKLYSSQKFELSRDTTFSTTSSVIHIIP